MGKKVNTQLYITYEMLDIPFLLLPPLASGEKERVLALIERQIFDSLVVEYFYCFLFTQSWHYTKDDRVLLSFNRLENIQTSSCALFYIR